MSFQTLLTHQITTYRNLPTGVGIQKSYQKNLFNVQCLIQSVTAEYAAKINQVFGRTYKLFVPLNTDITLTDHITDQDGKTYTVTGSQLRNYGTYGNQFQQYVITEQTQSSSTGTDI